MRVLLIPGDTSACGHLRMIWPGQANKMAGVDVTISNPDDEDDEAHMRITVANYSDGSRVVVDVEPCEYDVVVMQRPLAAEKAQVVKHLQKQGVKVIIEVDDDFERISPRNIAWKASDPHHSPAHNREWLMGACEIADLVICTTPALAERYGRRTPTRVIPNFIPGWHLEPHILKFWEGMRLGWAGQIATHPDDFRDLGGVIPAVLRATGARFFVIGGTSGVQKAIGVPVSLVDSLDYTSLDDYPDALAQMDVGMVPLAITPFNQAKSYLKGLEYAAAGVPFVADATDPYIQLAKMGAGVIADSRLQWKALLRTLLTQDSLREDLAGRGKAVAATQTIELNAHLWAEAWESTLK